MRASRGTTSKKSNANAKMAGISDLMSQAFNISFNLTVEESNMISLAGRTLERDMLISMMMKALDRPGVVVDGYACVGGDTLSFMQMAFLNQLTLQIHAVQGFSADEKVDPTRIERLKSHVDQYFKKNPTTAKVTVANQCMQNFIVEHKDLQIDLLYLDPPWNLPEGFDLATNRGTDRKPSLATKIYISRIVSEVFRPFALAEARRPKFICFKAPTPFVEFSLALFEEVPSFSDGYKLKASIPFRDKRGAIRLYYHFLEDCREEKAMNPGAAEFVPGK